MRITQEATFVKIKSFSLTVEPSPKTNPKIFSPSTSYSIIWIYDCLFFRISKPKFSSYLAAIFRRKCFPLHHLLFKVQITMISNIVILYHQSATIFLCFWRNWENDFLHFAQQFLLFTPRLTQFSYRNFTRIISRIHRTHIMFIHTNTFNSFAALSPQNGFHRWLTTRKLCEVSTNTKAFLIPFWFQI